MEWAVDRLGPGAWVIVAALVSRRDLLESQAAAGAAAFDRIDHDHALAWVSPLAQEGRDQSAMKDSHARSDTR
jgi:hypothetical protein